jgi:hypothetical protein
MKQLLTSILLCFFATIFAHTPTWTKDIATIIYKNCSNCHRSGGLAPFSLMSYDDTYNNRYSLNASVSKKTMPPWPPDTKYSRLAHERVLSDDEIHLIGEWVTNNAPFGNVSEEPAKPVFVSNEVITNPDVSFTIPEITLNTTQDIYMCFPLPSGMTVDKFINGFECIPGNSEVVHHVLVYQDTSNQCFTLDAQYPGPGYLSFGGVGINNARLIGGWVPGTTPTFYPTGMGVRFPKNTNIIIQVHYPKGIVNKKDKTKINLKFNTAANNRELYILPLLNHTTNLTNGPLVIPANTIKTFNNQQKVALNISLLGVAPHMHLIGKNIKAYVVSVNNDTTNLINIDNWDFHWQGFYQFPKIKKIATGSTLFGQATYDNTTNNYRNPSNPPKLVQLGEQTTDEMFLVFFTFLAYQNGDENIVIDSTSTTATSEPTQKVSLKLYPNPTKNTLQLELNMPSSASSSIDVYNISGQLVKKISNNYQLYNGFNQIQIDNSDLTNGTYFIKLKTSEVYAIEKFVVEK